MRVARRRLLRLVPFALLGGAAATASAFNGKDVSARKIGGELDVPDHRGVRRRLADFRGRAVLIFFGYTRCPDVCPTTLTRMNDVLGILGRDAARVQVLWMTVDPQRDTQELLANYVPAFNGAFLGLRGTEAETDRVTRAFEIEYRILHYKDQVLVDHSAFGYLIDASGRTRVRFDYDTDARQIAEDVSAILGVR